MKKVIGLIGATALVSMMPAVPAFAESDNAASVQKDFGCGGFIPAEGDDDSYPGDGALFTNSETHSVISQKGAKITLICHFEIPEGQEPDSIRKAEGFVCNTWLGYTTDTRMLATPDGDATLWCRLTPEV